MTREGSMILIGDGVCLLCCLDSLGGSKVVRVEGTVEVILLLAEPE